MSDQSNKIFIRKVLGSKIFLFAVVLILIWLVLGVGRESYRKYQLTKEIKNLKEEITKLEGNNQQLSNLLEYFQDKSYLEKEARLKLNLTKPGEKVVIVPESGLVQESPKENPSVNDQAEDFEEGIIGFDSSLTKTSQTKTETPNWWKWWEYFFQSSPNF